MKITDFQITKEKREGRRWEVEFRINGMSFNIVSYDEMRSMREFLNWIDKTLHNKVNFRHVSECLDKENAQ